MSKLTNANFPLLAKALFIACDFDKSVADAHLTSLVRQANEGKITLNDCHCLDDAFEWGSTEESGYTWGGLDDHLEDTYTDRYTYFYGFEDGEETMNTIINESKHEYLELDGVEFPKVLKVLIVGFGDVAKGQEIYDRLIEHKDNADLDLENKAHLGQAFYWGVADELLGLDFGLWIDPDIATKNLTPVQIDIKYREMIGK